MGAPRAAVEVRVGEVLRLQEGEQIATAQVEVNRSQPCLEQGPGVVGPDVGGDLALAGGPLGDRPLGDLQHRSTEHQQDPPKADRILKAEVIRDRGHEYKFDKQSE